MFQWGTGQDITMTLDRNGEEILIDTKLTPAFATTETILELEDANQKQRELRTAWLKG